jgi:hypothetical protein
MSDRNVKENFQEVNRNELLERLQELPIGTWNYKAQERSVRHIGPTAQDFSAALGLGEDPRFISTVDADGVALAAIQGLYELLLAKEQQIRELEARIAVLESERSK